MRLAVICSSGIPHLFQLLCNIAVDRQGSSVIFGWWNRIKRPFVYTGILELLLSPFLKGYRFSFLSHNGPLPCLQKFPFLLVNMVFHLSEYLQSSELDGSTWVLFPVFLPESFHKQCKWHLASWFLRISFAHVQLLPLTVRHGVSEWWPSSHFPRDRHCLCGAPCTTVAMTPGARCQHVFSMTLTETLEPWTKQPKSQVIIVQLSQINPLSSKQKRQSLQIDYLTKGSGRLLNDFVVG